MYWAEFARQLLLVSAPWDGWSGSVSAPRHRPAPAPTPTPRPGTCRRQTFRCANRAYKHRANDNNKRVAAVEEADSNIVSAPHKPVGDGINIDAGCQTPTTLLVGHTLGTPTPERL